MNFFELFQYDFFSNALIGSIFASIVCGIIGTYIVVKRLVFISGGITHASLGGLGIGFYLGVNPFLAAMIFSIFSAFGIQWFTSRQGVREDSAIGAFWSFGMAIGIICIYLKAGFAPNLSDYLFGNILTITRTDIYMFVALSIILGLVFSFFHREILYTSFDPDFARTRHLPVKLIEYTMMFFIAVSIVLIIRLVGVVLLMSLLTIPQMTANLYTANYSKIIFLSILFGLIGCVVGLILSAYINVPSGAFIIFTLIAIFFICKIVCRISGIQPSKA
ncbi:metal ABC transporter permease [Dysgonomonas macrotermitis]|uniref:Zinc transport system permease protein n=1 Tax=Dysgonomonas macrotermitis TaxID=1346286 RepID=A0A1M4U707_9BACT|nr:metal ABC transporter permease [Dysgonomonas macrotermitis]SHE52377.1 zinc transport system permease protein [Dysgonomonas macrotermitis]